MELNGINDKAESQSSEFEPRNPGFSGFVDMGELVFIRKGMIRGV